MTAPALHLFERLLTVNRRYYHFVVKFNKSRVLELCTRVRHGSRAHRFKEFIAGQVRLRNSCR